MKQTKLFAIAAVTVMAAISCSKEPVATPQKEATADTGTTLSVTAGCETRAWLDASTSTNVMKWRPTDILVVFDNELNGVALETTAKNTPTATFTTDKWTGKTPMYAAACCPNYGESNVLTCPSEGVMTVKFRAVHTIDNLSSSSFQSSAMVGKIEENGGEYSVSEMKNVMGFIGFSLSTAKVKTVTAESIGGEAMSGWVDVDYEKLVKGDKAFWTATSGKAQESLITLTPAPKGAANGGTEAAPLFKAGTYYFAVLPQTYSQGIKFTVYGADDTVIAEQTIGASSGVTVTRSQKLNVSKAIDVIPLNLPETVVLDLNFGSGTNPLGFGELAAANETTTGETYPYEYKFNDQKTGNPTSTTFDFVVCKGSASGARYLFYNNTELAYGSGWLLNFTAANAWIKVPAIDGMYLQTVTVGCANTAKRWIRIKTSSGATTSIAQRQTAIATADGPGIMNIHFFNDGNDCETASMQVNKTASGTAYYIISASAGIYSQMTFTYTKTLPTR